MKEEKMPLIMKHIVWLNLAWQWRYLTDKSGFLFIGTHCIAKRSHWLCAAQKPFLLLLCLVWSQLYTIMTFSYSFPFSFPFFNPGVQEKRTLNYRGINCDENTMGRHPCFISVFAHGRESVFLRDCMVVCLSRQMRWNICWIRFCENIHQSTHLRCILKYTSTLFHLTLVFIPRYLRVLCFL